MATPGVEPAPSPYTLRLPDPGAFLDRFQDYALLLWGGGAVGAPPENCFATLA